MKPVQINLDVGLDPRIGSMWLTLKNGPFSLRKKSIARKCTELETLLP